MGVKQSMTNSLSLQKNTPIMKLDLNVVRSLGLYSVCAFAVAFYLIPYSQLDHLRMMPGDLGDARLNNYFLENIFLSLFRDSSSVFEMEFFAPFPYVIGFSDNLFGSSPIYLFFRGLTKESDTSFQLWFFSGYVLNFISAFVSLRWLGFNKISACVGALIFAFSLPTSARVGHVQLHYRFCIPLALTFFVFFLKDIRWRYLIWAAFFTMWQFYCAIYLGFFLLLTLGCMLVSYALLGIIKDFPEFSFSKLKNSWLHSPLHKRVRILGILFVMAGAMLLLFYPYIMVSQEYGAHRSYSEIALMLPRVQSYFYTSISTLYSSVSHGTQLPMRHEHQMFIGFIPLILVVVGIYLGIFRDRTSISRLFGLSLVILMSITLCVGGASLWYFVSKLPLASAIRAVARIDLVLLFIMAFFSAVAIKRVVERFPYCHTYVHCMLIPLLILEFSAVSMNVSDKDQWRNRLNSTIARVDKSLPDDAILFFAQTDAPFFMDELDAMWAALELNYPTMNGYSGLFPPRYRTDYKTDCSEIPQRLLSYDQFTGNDEYLSIINKVYPIGFRGCHSNWLVNKPVQTSIQRSYSAEEFRLISLEHLSSHMDGDSTKRIKLKVNNNNQQSIVSSVNSPYPVRISWRFITSNGMPLSGWDTRLDIPFDIESQQSLELSIVLDSSKVDSKAQYLEISLVQEGIFWAHDLGIKPLKIKWM